jgi:NIMA (never in mitosis gene a)-related kinase
MENYQITEQLAGSGGAIFGVRRLSDGRNFALKRVALLDLGAAARQQAKMELRLMQHLAHPHLVACEDAFLFRDEDLCIVMKRFDGGDLAGVLQASAQQQAAPMAEHRVMQWFVQIALSLHYLHSHSIIHRDIKAGNIFVDAANGTLAVGDFGIAKIMESRDAVTSVTSGTPLYMAPEVLHGNVCSCKSDVWALGCVLYELMCFRHPFEAKDPSSLVVKVIRGNFPPVPHGAYSDDLCRLLVRLLDGSPDTRPLIDDVLMSPYVMPHVTQYLRSPALFKLLEGDTGRATYQNLVAQMAALRIPMPSMVAAPSAGPSPRHSGAQQWPRPSPTRHDTSPVNRNLGANRVAESRRRESVAVTKRSPERHLQPNGTGTSSQYAPSARGHPGRSPSSVLGTPSPPRRVAQPRPGREQALYDACREHDDAFVKLRQTRDAHTMGSSSASPVTGTAVRDVVRRAMQSPAPVLPVVDTMAMPR